MITLADVYERPASPLDSLWPRRLYELLGERTPDQSISHREMPNWEDHLAFIASRPYMAWYVVLEGRDEEEIGWARGERTKPATMVGACYLTKQREIGLSIFKAHQRQGHGRTALKQLMNLHPGRFLANISPANEASIALFRSLGFGGPIQITLRRDA